MSDAALLATARDLIARVDPMTAGIWPRATALLSRQALEAALDDLWRRRAPGLELCSAKAQLLCLPSYLPEDEDLAERVSYAWAGLSRACDQHAYELSPTSPELIAWIDVVERLVERVAGVMPPAAGSTTKRRRAT